MSSKADREVLFEFQNVGGIIKISAVDVESKVEVSLQGASYANRDMLKKTALAKLNYVLAQKLSQKDDKPQKKKVGL